MSSIHADLPPLASRTWQYACFPALSMRSIARLIAIVGSDLPGRKINAKVARFRQINQDRRTSHRDALEFPDGEVVLLTSLWEGQHATVLQLPASATRSEDEVQTRASVDNEPALDNR